MLDQVKPDDVLHADYDYSATDFTLTSEALNQDTTAAKTINRYYDSLLRPRSYKVGSDYTTAYGYGSGGRMTDVWDNPLLDSTGDPVDSVDDALVTGDFTYGYATSSATLIGTITGPVHQVTNTWETTRDVLDSRENKDTTSDPDVVVSYFDYAVNSIGQRVGLATTGSAFSTAPQWDWDYNARGELVEADDLTTASINDRAYGYDSIGNREMTVNGLLDDLPDSDNWAANALNQYDSVPTPSGGSLVPVFDDDGNMTSGPLPVDQTANATLVWDAENRLVEVTTAGGTVIAYDYDYQSRRISSTVTPAQGTASTTYYLYDGWNLIAEYCGGIGSGLVDPEGSPEGSESLEDDDEQYSGVALVKSYTWGMDLSGSMQGAGGVGGLLAVTIPTGETNAGTYYPTYDGNVSEYLDSAGSVAAHFKYDPFGNEITPTTAQGLKHEEFPHRFSTKYLEAETELYYYGYRYYDPVTGRWPSRDPIGERGGVNLYGFVGNGSTNLIDVKGLADWVATDKYKFWIKDLGLFHRMVDSWLGTRVIEGPGDGDCCEVTRGRRKKSRLNKTAQAEQLYAKGGMQDEVVADLDVIASGAAIMAGMAAGVGLESVAAAFGITSGVAWLGESLARATLDPDAAEWRDL